MTRRFRITWVVTQEIDLEEEVIDTVDDEWREHLYPLNTEEDIVAHIAGNFLDGNRSLSMLDGWADQPDSNARLIDLDHYVYDVKEI